MNMHGRETFALRCNLKRDDGGAARLNGSAPDGASRVICSLFDRWPLFFVEQQQFGRSRCQMLNRFF